ncbi:MAG: hypothetical protein IKU11_11000, partial [Clostridia bacterium]|nr:hypothetical protein [Clostridia bacterium]
VGQIWEEIFLRNIKTILILIFDPSNPLLPDRVREGFCCAKKNSVLYCESEIQPRVEFENGI